MPKRASKAVSSIREGSPLFVSLVTRFRFPTDLDLRARLEPDQKHRGFLMSPNWIQAAGIGSFLAAISAVFMTAVFVVG
jgi:hypothetical protein